MTDRLEALERLARLKSSGILTLAEFEAEKARILGGESLGGPRGQLEPAGPPPASPPAFSWRSAASRPWLFGGGALAIAAGALLAYVVVGDVRSAAPARRSDHPGAPRTEGAAGTEAGAVNGTALGSLLAFRDSSTCTPGQGLEDLVGALASARSSSNPAADASVRVAGFEEAFVPSVARPAGSEDVVIIQIPLRGTWQGLHVARLHVATWGRDEPTTFQIQFDDPVGEVRSVLRQIGFPLGEAGELRKAGQALVGVEPVPGGSALTCARPPKSLTTDAEENAT